MILRKVNNFQYISGGVVLEVSVTYPETAGAFRKVLLAKLPHELTKGANYAKAIAYVTPFVARLKLCDPTAINEVIRAVYYMDALGTNYYPCCYYDPMV